jgi:predicted MFS family arabinose efflux permease
MKTRRDTYGIVFAATASAGLLFGWSIACVNPVLPTMRSAMGLSATQSGFVVSAVAAGALIGCLIGAKLLDHIGTRNCLAAAGCVSTLGAVAAAFAGGATTMVFARTAVGIGVGLMSAATPIFVAARSDAHRRAMLLTAYQLTITVGILAALFIGWVLNENHVWRTIIGLNATPAVLLILFAGFSSADTIKVAPQQTSNTAEKPRDNKNSRGIVIAFAASLMNALTGVGLIMYYSTDIFAAASRAIAADVASFIVGTANVVATVIAVPLVAALKRRTLLTIGLIGMAVSLATVAAGLMAARSGGGLFAVGGSIAYIAFFAISAGPLAWLLVAEVAPPSRQSAVTSAAVATNWASNMLLAFAFPIFTGIPPDQHRVAYFCLLFAALSIVFVVFVRVVTPETKGLTLDEIQDALAHGPRMNRPS